ncbi:polysaccharide deacetylase [Bradyrhizobium sp. NP1]|uniref:polysaccharide deacetylase n=1 Tax=Bradyrhizobium sp. NP1 TaxID=3049772 RepID=UPI0025A61657|nr:polysaccharide deacetylase [Bradyrhizobium sp. NP1]WJR75822.1 polysaccharide deacetylase [Bradyrhizobium sp. NP1]
MLQYSYRPQFPETDVQRQGADQTWIDYLPITERPPLKWPGGARMAVMVCPNVLYYELMPPRDPWIDPWARMTPDVMMYGRQEFGARVGFWRMVDVLDKYNLPCTAVLNVAALAKFPEIRNALVERKWDILGHGMYNTRFICGYSEEQERQYYRDMRRIVFDETGVDMKGMGGPGPQAATENTPDLLAEEGFWYYSDFFHDDQPFPIRVRSNRLISMPYSVESNDVPVLATAYEADDFADLVKRQFDRLYTEGGRIMCFTVHPALIGQAQRAKYLDAALQHITSQSDVWFATGREIADYYLTHCYESVVRLLSTWQNV